MSETALEQEIFRLRIEVQNVMEERDQLLQMVHWIKTNLQHGMYAFEQMGLVYNNLRESHVHKHDVEAKP